jgi:hypothetical protein
LPLVFMGAYATTRCGAVAARKSAVALMTARL